jgi:hypothetical protein
VAGGAGGAVCPRQAVGAGPARLAGLAPHAWHTARAAGTTLAWRAALTADTAVAALATITAGTAFTTGTAIRPICGAAAVGAEGSRTARCGSS